MIIVVDTEEDYVYIRPQLLEDEDAQEVEDDEISKEWRTCNI